MGCLGINDDCLLWIALICLVLILLGNSDCCGNNGTESRTGCCG